MLAIKKKTKLRTHHYASQILRLLYYCPYHHSCSSAYNSYPIPCWNTLYDGSKLRKSQEDNILGVLFKASCENSQKAKLFHTKSLTLKLFTVYPDKLLSSKSLSVVSLVLSRILLTKLYLWASSFPWLTINNLRHIFKLFQLLNMLITSKWVLSTSNLFNLKCEHRQLVSIVVNSAMQKTTAVTWLLCVQLLGCA